MSAADARRDALGRQAEPQPKRTSGSANAVPLFRDFVAGPWKQVHFERYKPSGQRTASKYLKRQLLPAFGSKPLDRIAPAHVRRWFDRYSRTAPGGANRALDILRQIMNFAVACGHIETDPTRGVRRNRRPGTHQVPVPRGSRPPPSRSGSPGPEGHGPAGRHRPPPAADRMPQGRDRRPAMVRGSR